MGGSSTTMPSAPPAPAPIDPGKSSIDYVRAMSDPKLQGQILASEQTYRPQYTALELADINTMLRGGGGQAGLLDIQDEATRRQNQIMAEASSAQRSADIADVENLGGRASAAFLAANPELNAALQQADLLRTGQGTATNQQIRDLVAQGVDPAQAQQIAQSQLGAGLQQAGMSQLQATTGENELNAAGAGQLQAATGENELNAAGLDFLQRGGNLTPLQLRNVQQQARISSQARGRLEDQSAITGEIAARLAQEMDLERQNAATGAALLGQGFGMGQQRLGTASGLLSQGFGMGQQRLSTASGIYGQDLARDQANLNAGLAIDQANLNARVQQRGMGLQGLLGLGQLEQSGLQADRAYAMSLIGARQATASDPFQAILGRPAQAPGAGMASAQFAAGLAQQPVGPQLFDPNAGINLALQQQSNMANYQSSIYGAQAGYAGASNQGNGAMMGGIASGVGALAGGALIVF